MSEWGRYFDALASKEPREVSTAGRLSRTGQATVRKIQDDISKKLRLERDDVLLDLGCGTGLLSSGLSQRVGRFVGLDYGAEVLKRAKRSWTSSNGHVSLLQGDITALPFEDECFTKVLCYSVVHYLPSYADFKRALAEMLRVVREGGQVLVGDIPDQKRKEAWTEGRRRYDEPIPVYVLRRSWEKYVQFKYRIYATRDARRRMQLGIEPPNASGSTFDEETLIAIVKELGVKGQILGQPSSLPFSRTRVDLLIEK